MIWRVSAAVIAVALIFIVAVLMAASGLSWPLALLGVAVMSVSCVREARRLRWKADLLKPAFWIGTAYSVVYGIGGARLVLHDPTRNLELYLWFIAGFGALSLGLQLGGQTHMSCPLRPRRAIEPRKRKRFVRLMKVGLALGLFAAIVYISKGGGLVWFAQAPESERVDLARQGGAFGRLMMFGLIPWVWFALVDRRTRRMLPQWLLFSGASVAILAIALAGNRAPLVMLFGVSAMIHVSWPGSVAPLTKRFWVAGVGIVVAVGMVFGAWGAYRLASDLRTSNYPEIGTHLEPINWPVLAATQTLIYLGRGAENTAAVMDAIPSIVPYRYGGSYLDPFRTIKPGRQDTLDMQLKQALNMRFAGGGFVPSTLGEAYVNFGKFGFVVVPLVLGMILATLYRYWRSTGGLVYGLAYIVLLYYLSVHMVSGILASSIILPYCLALVTGAGLYLRERG
jgi:hypothetical protein